MEINFNHCGMTCKDPIAFENFYTKYFGFIRTRSFDIGEGKQIVYIKNHQDFYFEIFPAEIERPVPQPEADGPTYSGIRHLAFKVNNVDDALKEMGDDAIITLGPLSFDAFIKGWKTVWLKDPEGNIVEISEGYKDKD